MMRDEMHDVCIDGPAVLLGSRASHGAPPLAPPLLPLDLELLLGLALSPPLSVSGSGLVTRRLRLLTSSAASASRLGSAPLCCSFPSVPRHPFKF